MKNIKKIYQFYDKTYKKLFSHTRIVEDFLNGFVNEKFIHKLVILENVSNEFTARGFKGFRSDLIWKARIKNTDCFVFLLFEFQSREDKYIALRVLNYIVQLYLLLVKNDNYKLPLPPVFPIVVHTGKNRFSSNRNTKNMIMHLDHALNKYIPDFQFFVFDINDLSKSTALRLSVLTKNLASLLFSIDKIDEIKLSEELNKIIELLRKNAPIEIIQDFQDFLLGITSEYDYERINLIKTIDKEESMFYETLKKWRTRNIEEGWQKGRLKGQQEGKEEGIQKGIQKGMQQKLEENIKSLHSNGISANEIARLLKTEITFVRKIIRSRKKITV